MFFDRFCIFATSLCILPACAGINPINFLFFSLAGYSPRMRGVNPEGGVRTTRRDGIHPACAGVNPALSSSHGSKKGFSLHARGSTRRKSFAVNILTILPARAGVNPYLFAFLVPDADSPHMRGGQPAWEYCFATCE